MNTKKMSQALLQIRLSIKDISPEIWRRIFVRSDATFAQLHLTLQSLMSWSNHHFYSFKAGESRYAPPQEIGYEFGKSKSVRTKLSSIFGENTTSITYQYDFKDGWGIELCLEKTFANTGQAAAALCTEGARHGPAEDSGGPRGYMEKVNILKNSNHKRHQQIKDWIGPRFDAEEFDLGKTNEMLRRIG